MFKNKWNSCRTNAACLTSRRLLGDVRLYLEILFITYGNFRFVANRNALSHVIKQLGKVLKAHMIETFSGGDVK